VLQNPGAALIGTVYVIDARHVESSNLSALGSSSAPVTAQVGARPRSLANLRSGGSLPTLSFHVDAGGDGSRRLVARLFSRRRRSHLRLPRQSRGAAALVCIEQCWKVGTSVGRCRHPGDRQWSSRSIVPPPLGLATSGDDDGPITSVLTSVRLQLLSALAGRDQILGEGPDVPDDRRR